MKCSIDAEPGDHRFDALILIPETEQDRNILAALEQSFVLSGLGREVIPTNSILHVAIPLVAHDDGHRARRAMSWIVDNCLQTLRPLDFCD